jgi:ankyrin repeat protein
LYVACQNGHYDVVEWLIRCGASLEAKYKGFYTPLYIAAQKGHLKILKLLIENGADIEQKW